MIQMTLILDPKNIDPIFETFMTFRDPVKILWTVEILILTIAEFFLNGDWNLLFVTIWILME